MDPRQLASLTAGSIVNSHKDWTEICRRLARLGRFDSRVVRHNWADDPSCVEEIVLEMFERFGGDGDRDLVVSVALREALLGAKCPSCRGWIVPEEANVAKCPTCNGRGWIRHTWRDRAQALGVSIWVYRYRWHKLYGQVLERIGQAESNLSGV